MRIASSSLIAIFFVACADEPQTPEAVQTRVALEAFSSCEELEAYIEDTAVQEMRVLLDSYLENDYFLRAFAVDDFAAPAAEASTQGSGPTAYTKTNTQVSGVDEADFVKTNGTHIFVLSGNKLYASKTWPAAEMALAGTIEVEGYPVDMFLEEETGRIVVLSHYYPSFDHTQAVWCEWGCYWWGPMTKVTVIDASDPSALRLIDSYLLKGSYRSSRRIGSSVRLVLSDWFGWPEGVRTWPSFEGDWEKDRGELKRAIERQKELNERLIRAAELDDWLPKGKRILPDGSETVLAPDCTDFHRSNAPTRLGLATVVSLELDRQTIDHTAVLGDVGEIYASKSSLYIASPHWWWWPRAGQTSHTYLHKFDITDPADAIYVASGGVDGYVLNQFAMDEHEGFLRVATTVDSWVEDDDFGPWGRNETTNRVSVLSERSGALKVIGKTSDVAKGERIQSARFMGDRGYLVTFEQIDPLFTLDLSQPEQPRIVGELKIPGFSSYLHPLDENHLLAIGVDLPEPRDGRVDWMQRRMKLTIFDVSDFARPVVKHETTVGTAYGWSEAAFEHKAFNYFPERGVLAIPFSDWDPVAADYWDSFVSDLRIFTIDVDRGIVPNGSIDMSDLYREYRYDQWSWFWSPSVRRSVMADDFAYAISDAGIRAAKIGATNVPLATVLFDGADARAP
jgi:hypothetical protein